MRRLQGDARLSSGGGASASGGRALYSTCAASAGAAGEVRRSAAPTAAAACCSGRAAPQTQWLPDHVRMVCEGGVREQVSSTAETLVCNPATALLGQRNHTACLPDIARGADENQQGSEKKRFHFRAWPCFRALSSLYNWLQEGMDAGLGRDGLGSR